MFQSALKELVEGVDGGVASLVMGLDGIEIDKFSVLGAPCDITAVGTEFSVVLRAAHKASTMLDAGGTHELALTAELLTTVARMIDGQHFVAVALATGGNIGKARYLLRLLAPDMAEALR